MNWFEQRLEDLKRPFIGRDYTFEIDELGTEFSKYMTPKEKEEFVRDCKQMRDMYDVPLFTFRCHDCENLFPVTDLSGQVVFKNESGKIDVGQICMQCEQN